MQTKNANGSLVSRYKAVLKKCNLLNVFGTLALATMCALPANALAFDIVGDIEGTNEYKSGAYEVMGGSDFVVNNEDDIIWNTTQMPDPSRTTRAGILGYMTAPMSEGFKFTNNDSITVNTNISNATESTLSAGLFATGNGDHVLKNSKGATIEINHTSNDKLDADGMHISGDAGQGSYDPALIYTNNHIMENAGTIIVNAGSADSTKSANSVAMYIESNGNHQITNTGTITMNNKASDSQSAGMQAEAMMNSHGTPLVASGDFKLVNAGTIHIISAGEVDGIRADSMDDDNPAHTGNHTIINEKGATITLEGHGDVHALKANSGQGNHTIINKGTLNLVGRATQTSGSSGTDPSSVIAIHAGTGSTVIEPDTDPSVGNRTVENTGTINAIAYGDGAVAIGVYFGSTQAGGINTITSKGLINVAVAGKNGFTGEVTGTHSFTVGEYYALSLRDRGANELVFHSELGEVTFDQTTLILYPGSVDFTSGKEYAIADMVTTGDLEKVMDTGDLSLITQATSINGAIKGVETGVDYAIASITGTETSSGYDPMTAKVSLTLNNTELPAPVLAENIVTATLNQMSNISTATRNAVIDAYVDANTETVAMNGDNAGMSAGSSVAPTKWTVFATPYGSYSNNSKHDYNSHSFGVTAGGSYNFNSAFSLGFHLDLNAAQSDSDTFDNDTTSYAFGVHGNYFVNPQWYIGGQITASFGNNDIDYTQAIGKASDDFNSSAFFTAIKTGYVYEVNKENVIVPELSIAYLYTHNDSYAFEYANNAGYNMNVHSSSYDDVYADLTVTWQGKYETAKGIIKPKLGIGIRQSLTGNDIKTTQELFNSGLATDASVSSDKTRFLANAGLEWTSGKFTLGGYYDGEFGSHQQTHAGSVKFMYKF